MKKEFLIELGISDDVAKKIMDANGTDIENVRKQMAAVEGQLTEAQRTIAEREGQLAELKKIGDPAALQQEITRLQGENATAKQAAEKKIAEMKLDSDVNAYVSGIKFSSDLAKRAFVADFKTKGFKQDETTGAFLGADDFLKTTREQNPAAFEPNKAGSAGFYGKASPQESGAPGGSGSNSFMNNIIRGNGGE